MRRTPDAVVRSSPKVSQDLKSLLQNYSKGEATSPNASTRSPSQSPRQSPSQSPRQSPSQSPSQSPKQTPSRSPPQSPSQSPLPPSYVGANRRRTRDTRGNIRGSTATPIRAPPSPDTPRTSSRVAETPKPDARAKQSLRSPKQSPKQSLKQSLRSPKQSPKPLEDDDETEYLLTEDDTSEDDVQAKLSATHRPVARKPRRRHATG